MSEDIDPAVIKKTQEILGSVIKKPALTEKLLKRPPFKFLHDVISNVIKSSGFMKGLYSPEELQADNVKDKESKIIFLQKAVDVLSLATNQPVNLKLSKVVAGHDAEKTNAFLQALGKAVKSKLDSSEAVEKVLKDYNHSSPTKPAKERRASVDKKSKEKAHSRSLTKTLDPVKKSSKESSSHKESSKESSKSKDGEKSKEKSRESKKERDKSKDRTKHKSEDSKKSREKSSRIKESPKIEDKVEPEQKETVNGLFDDLELMSPLKTVTNEESAAVVNGEAHEKDPSEFEASENASEKPVREKSHRSHSSRSARPPSARSKRTKPSEENDSVLLPGPGEPMMATSASVMGSVSTYQEPANENSENVLMPLARPPTARPGSARPSSSRPAPPRIRIRHVVDNEENSFRPATAKPVENVILDQGHQSEEEEESFIVVEDEPVETLEEEVAKTQPAKTPDEDKGSLVKKLLETKKDLEGGSQHTPTKKVEIDKSQMTDVARSRERDSASKELNQLRGYVQSLSKTAVPLGRMLDFLQEDMDAMKMELKMWMEEHAQNLVALRKEESATESLLEPLRAQLDDLDQVVQNQLEANSALKASIARNDERILRMLSSVSHKS